MSDQQLDDGESAAYAAAGKEIDSEAGADKEQEKVPHTLFYGEDYFAAANMLTPDQIQFHKLMEQEVAKEEKEEAERSAINEANVRSHVDAVNRCKAKGEELTVIRPELEEMWRKSNPTRKYNQDSLDGAHAPISEVGSTEAVGTTFLSSQILAPLRASPPREIRTTLTPRSSPPQFTLKSLSNVLTSKNASEENAGDIANGHESREAENENGDRAQDAINAEEVDRHVNGEAEVDLTEVERSYLLELEEKYEKGVLTLDEDADRAAIYAYTRIVPPVKVPADMISSFKSTNEEYRSRGFSDRWLINEAGSTVQSLASRPLDSAQASISEVGSTEEISERDNTNDAPSEANTGDVGFISESYQISGPFKASPPRKISTTLTPPDTPPSPSPQNTLKSLINVLTSRNATEEKPTGVPDHIGHESCATEKENGDHAQYAIGAEEVDRESEADSTEVEGVVAEMRKLDDEVEGDEKVTADVEAPTNGDSV